MHPEELDPSDYITINTLCADSDSSSEDFLPANDRLGTKYQQDEEFHFHDAEPSTMPSRREVDYTRCANGPPKVAKRSTFLSKEESGPVRSAQSSKVYNDKNFCSVKMLNAYNHVSGSFLDQC